MPKYTPNGLPQILTLPKSYVELVPYYLWKESMIPDCMRNVNNAFNPQLHPPYATIFRLFHIYVQVNPAAEPGSRLWGVGSLWKKKINLVGFENHIALETSLGFENHTAWSWNMICKPVKGIFIIVGPIEKANCEKASWTSVGFG